MELYSEPGTEKLINGGKLNYGRQIPIDPIPYRRGESKPEQSWHHFTPASFGIKFAPEDFRAKIKEIDPRFEVIWHPVNQRWVVWAHMPNEIKHPRMKGWKLILVVQYGDDESYMPLDARTLARSWDRCGRKYHSMAAYWANIEAEQDKEYADRVNHRRQDVRDMASEQWDHTRIQVSMRGKSTGSKFSKHHS
jgi:hypothetical protein